MNILEFTPSYQVPTKPGEYLVITDKMEYLHTTAIFQQGQFLGFSNSKQRRVPAADVLCYSAIKPARKVVQDTYTAFTPPQRRTPSLEVIHLD